MSAEDIKNSAMRLLLDEANLSQYYDSFIRIGGDDVDQLVNVMGRQDEFAEILELVGMSDKPLHIKRLKQALELRIPSTSRSTSSSSTISSPSVERRYTLASSESDQNTPSLLLPIAPPFTGLNSSLDSFQNVVNPEQMHMPQNSYSVYNQQFLAYALRFLNPITSFPMGINPQIDCNIFTKNFPIQPQSNSSSSSLFRQFKGQYDQNDSQRFNPVVERKRLFVTEDLRETCLENSVSKYRKSSDSFLNVLTKIEILKINIAVPVFLEHMPKFKIEYLPSSNSKNIPVEKLLLIPENDPFRSEQFRVYTNIFGLTEARKTDSKKKHYNPYNMAVNEISLMVALAHPEILRRRDYLFCISRQIHKITQLGMKIEYSDDGKDKIIWNAGNDLFESTFTERTRRYQTWLKQDVDEILLKVHTQLESIKKEIEVTLEEENSLRILINDNQSDEKLVKDTRKKASHYRIIIEDLFNEFGNFD